MNNESMTWSQRNVECCLLIRNILFVFPIPKMNFSFSPQIKNRGASVNLQDVRYPAEVYCDGQIIGEAMSL